MHQKLTWVAFIWMGLWSIKAKFRNVLDREINKQLPESPLELLPFELGHFTLYSWKKQMVNLNYMHRAHYILQSSKLKWAVHWLIFWWPFYVLLVHKLLTRNKHFMKRQKTKNWRECLEINSMFQTSVGCFFSVLSHLFHELKTWFKLSRVKFYGSYLKGD